LAPLSAKEDVFLVTALPLGRRAVEGTRLIKAGASRATAQDNNMSTTTGVQLTELAAPYSEASQRPMARATATNKVKAPDAVLEASRAADSEAPDGGYGWVVIGAGAVLLWWSLGITYAWGVVQSALVDDDLANPATLSFIGSLQAALISALAIIETRIMRSIGTRYTAMLGAAFMGVSGILSSFTTNNVGGLFFTAGVLMGVGAGCVSLLPVLAI
jgi:hypothetical protein